MFSVVIFNPTRVLKMFSGPFWIEEYLFTVVIKLQTIFTEIFNTNIAVIHKMVATHNGCKNLLFCC